MGDESSDTQTAEETQDTAVPEDEITAEDAIAAPAEDTTDMSVTEDTAAEIPAETTETAETAETEATLPEAEAAEAELEAAVTEEVPDAAVSVNDEGIYADTVTDAGTLKGAKELATGLKSDKTPMEGGNVNLAEQLSSLSIDINSARLNVDFAEGETEKVIEIIPVDNSDGDGDRVFQIFAAGGSEDVLVSELNGLAVTIADDEEQELAVISFSESSYEPAGGFLSVTLNREGALNQVVSATVKTMNDTAQGGRDYSIVDTSVVFPYGIKSRTIKIPVRETYVGEDAAFKIMLSEPVKAELGDITEAVCKVFQQNKTVDEQVALMATETQTATVSSILTDDNSKKLGKDAYDKFGEHDGSAWIDGNNLVIKSDCDIYDWSWSGAKFNFGTHYDYSGIRIDWKRDCSRLGSGGVEVKAHSTYNDGNDTVVYSNFSEENWGQRTNDIFVPGDKLGVIHVNQKDSFFALKSHLTVYSVTPILRPFEVRLVESEPLYFLQADGTYMPNTLISDSLQTANKTKLKYANNDNGVALRFSGQDITVGTDSSYAYIKGLELVSEDGFIAKTVVDNLPVGTTSASFTLNNDFIKNNLEFFTFSDNPDRGRKGSVKVRAILDYYDTTITLNTDKRGSVAINNAPTLENYYEAMSKTPAVINECGLYRIKNAKSGKYLTSNGDWRDATQENSRRDGKDVWKIIHKGSGYYNLMAMDGNLLNIPNASNTNGAQIDSGGDNGHDSKKFAFVPTGNGTYGIVAKISNNTKCVCTFEDRTDAGVKVHLWDYHKDNPAQNWILEEITPAPGKMYKIKGVQSGKYLTNQYNNAKGSVTLQNNTDEAGSMWYIKPTGTTFELINGSGYALDINGGSSANGAKVQTWNKNESDAQRFQFIYSSDGYVGIGTKLTGFKSGADVEGYNTNAGAKIHQWTYNGTSNQKWIFEECSNTKATGNIQYHKGDTLQIRQQVNSEYESTYTQSRVQLITKENSNDASTNANFEFNDGGNCYTTVNKFISITVNPLIEKKNNVISVRIKASDLQYFDTSRGVFTSPRETDGEYYDYTVVNKDNFSEGAYYELPAAAKSGYVARWSMSFNNKAYTQETLYFYSRHDIDDNVIQLTAVKSADKPFTLTGKLLHANVSLNGQSESTAFYPATGSYVAIGERRGLADDKGNFTMVPMPSVKGGLVIYKTVMGERVEYKEVQLSNNPQSIDFSSPQIERSISAYKQNIGNITVSAYNSERPHVQGITVTDNNNSTLTDTVPINDDITRFTISIANDGAAYVDGDGNPMNENVKEIKLIVYDGVTNEKKSEITGFTKSTFAGIPVWTASSTFKRGERTSYSSSDRLFVQITTDRVIGNGKMPQLNDRGEIIAGNYVTNEALQQTTYAPIFTGYTFTETNLEEPVKYDVELPTDMNFIQLPLIGSMVASFNVKSFSIGIDQLDNNTIRLSLGYMPKSADLKKQESTADTGKHYGLLDLKDAVNDLKEFGKQTNDLASLGMSSWGLAPIFGIFIDFKLATITDNGGSHYDWFFNGGGAYIGVTGKFRFVQYFIIVCVPCYFGVEGELTVYSHIGFKRDEKDDLPITLEEIGRISEPFTGTFGFTADVGAHGSVSAYVGAGICGTLGVRGGIGFNAGYVFAGSEMINNTGINPNGLILSADIKVWVDAFLFSLSVPCVSLLEKKYGYYAEINQDNSVSLFGEEEAVSEPVFRERSSKNSKWVAPSEGDVSLFSTFEERETNILLENGYEHADPQLIDLGEDRYLLVFVGDAGDSRDDFNRTAVMYSVYENGGWSKPEIIQKDDTGDFEPNVTDVGDKILISWTSRNSTEQAEANDYIKSMEVYTTTLDKATLEIGEIAQLTNDQFYDSAPVGMYDASTGDMVVYYLKSDVNDDAEFQNNVSPTLNESVIVYMLYDNSKGEWARTYYYDNEVVNQDAADILVEQYGGQRFLSSPLADFGEVDPDTGIQMINDPIIIDFDAISYNGIGVYTYTVDEDNNLDTTGDRELFVQFYDFADHKTYVPVRITNNNLADARPQLVRNGDNTYLFWLENEKDIRYINVTDLVKNGLNDDGSLNADYDLNVGIVFFTNNLGDNINPTFGSFKPYVDNEGNLFITWLQPVTDEETGKSCQEVFAIALISSDTEADLAWSSGVQLTDSGMFNDEVSFITDDSGHLMVVNNQYDMDLSTEDYNVTNMKLVSTRFETVGSVKVDNVVYADETPLEDSENQVTITLLNDGLKTANGYSLNVYENIDGTIGDTPIYTSNSENKILPSGTIEETFSWHVPADLSAHEDVSLYMTVQEADMDEVSEYTSESLNIGAEYELSNCSVEQTADGIFATFSVTNIGNAKSEMYTEDEEVKGDKIVIAFNDLYHTGAEFEPFAETFIGELGVGDTQTYTTELDIDEAAYNGTITNGYMEAQNIEGEDISSPSTFTFSLKRPQDIIVNGEDDLESITLKAGESIALEGSYSQTDLYPDGEISFQVEDTDIAYIDDDGNLVGVQAGNTILSAMLLPYGGERKINVVIESTRNSTASSGGGGGGLIRNTPTPAPTETPTPTETATPEATEAPAAGTTPQRFNDVSATDWFFNSVEYTAEKGCFNGTGNGMFEPYTNVTRGMLVTVLGRLEGISDAPTATVYSDVDSNAYYAAHIAWATENGIVDGYGDGLFGPDDLVTREQMAKITANYISYKTDITAGSTPLEYTDAADISDWAQEYVAFAAEQGIMNGNADGTFAPKSFATRAETAAVIERIDRLIASQE